MKRNAFVVIFLVILLFLYGCKASENKNEINEERVLAGEGLQDIVSLSEIQVDACNAAYDAGTCDTRLSELGVVSKEDCCQVLAKCC